jgi:hypothetical protein
MAGQPPEAMLAALAVVLGAAVMIGTVFVYVVTPPISDLLYFFGAGSDPLEYHDVEPADPVGDKVRASVGLDILSVDPANGTAQAECSIVLVKPAGRSAQGEGTSFALVLPDERLTATLSLANYETTWSAVALASSDDERRPRQRITLDLYGTPQNFPRDNYSLYLDPTLRFSRTITVEYMSTATGVVKSREELRRLPVVVGIRALRPPDFQIDLVLSRRLKEGNSGQPLPDVVLGRGETYPAFVYALSLSPTLIVLAFYSVGLRTRRRRLPENLSPLELATALLALLALRQVLVPTNVPGMTNVDKLLAFELTAIVAVTLVTYIWSRGDSVERG